MVAGSSPARGVKTEGIRGEIRGPSVVLNGAGNKGQQRSAELEARQRATQQEQQDERVAAVLDGIGQAQADRAKWADQAERADRS